jgi:hypothetical protein
MVIEFRNKELENLYEGEKPKAKVYKLMTSID